MNERVHITRKMLRDLFSRVGIACGLNGQCKCSVQRRAGESARGWWPNNQGTGNSRQNDRAAKNVTCQQQSCVLSCCAFSQPMARSLLRHVISSRYASCAWLAATYMMESSMIDRGLTTR